MEAMNRHILRGDIYLADLRPAVGSEQNGVRPVLIVQNNTGNQNSPTVIAAAITGKQTKARIPTHVRVGNAPGMRHSAVILLEQLRTLDKSRLLHYISSAEPRTMAKVDRALKTSVGLIQKRRTNRCCYSLQDS